MPKVKKFKCPKEMQKKEPNCQWRLSADYCALKECKPKAYP